MTCIDAAKVNGLNGLQMLTAEEIREIEPHAAGIREQSRICAVAATSPAGTDARKTWFLVGPAFAPKRFYIRGKLIDDFHFVYTEGMVHVCNVPSPAATASLAIGRYIVNTIVKRGGGNLAAARANLHGVKNNGLSSMRNHLMSP